ncbi:hypothetical protein DF3PA_280015 [Candidatus Defluviicoccus seviourii]|uniref:Uncharacterized protein n=1 Tax=Candidatus Defluviicoccus seviourii TaxID=2565273 RepID=A0A564WFH3_9PROT|nr:hypothetical protein DF3PA_280015 [Candidatus Defluviicoccus seviourii]
MPVVGERNAGRGCDLGYLCGCAALAPELLTGHAERELILDGMDEGGRLIEALLAHPHGRCGHDPSPPPLPFGQHHPQCTIGHCVQCFRSVRPLSVRCRPTTSGSHRSDLRILRQVIELRNHPEIRRCRRSHKGPRSVVAY